jgi:hypothetical protein
MRVLATHSKAVQNFFADARQQTQCDGEREACLKSAQRRRRSAGADAAAASALRREHPRAAGDARARREVPRLVRAQPRVHARQRGSSGATEGARWQCARSSHPVCFPNALVS